MRIGLDMLATQSPHHAHRGIGRYAHNLATTLLRTRRDDEFVLYVHRGLRQDLLPDPLGATVRTIEPETAHGERSIVPRMDRLVRENPDRLDALVLLSPIEKWDRFVPPAPAPGGPALVSVVYDLIPLLVQDEPGEPPLPASYLRSVAELRRYDRLLAISESTRRDCLNILSLAGDRVVNISAACDSSLFHPGPSTPEPREFAHLGIDRPFVYDVGGMDPRKNVRGLVDAFALLPPALRGVHQLVITCQIADDEATWLRAYAAKRGVGEALVITGEIPDATLRRLYQCCAAFVFPSFYEGFGLPILEAMRCGAPVIAANNSSQPEVAGDAGLLVNATDPGDIAARLASVLGDPERAAAMRRRSLEQADRFSWERTAAAALEAIGSCVRERPRPPRFRPRGRAKPRLAFFSPLPPHKSGVADYAMSLLGELAKTYAIDLYHAPDCTPDAAWSGLAESCADARMFDRLRPFRGYRGIVYQMGNSRYHHFLYPSLLRFPGVTTLHDYCLAGFHLGYGDSLGRKRGYFAEELRATAPGQAEAILPMLGRESLDPEELIAACSRLGAAMNRRVFEHSRRVVVHSPWCVDRLRESNPELVPRAAVIPLGASAARLDPAGRSAIRARFGLADDALIVAAFGFIHPDKMSGEALEAFVTVARDDPRAVFLFVGQDADAGYTRRRAEELGLIGRVRFLGRQSAANFADLAAAADIGFNLRRPPTNGETSAALLNLLSWGVPTIVTDVGTFADYPDHVVRKVRWEADGQGGLDRALAELVRDRAARAAIGRAAWERVRDVHDWAKVAEHYVEVIERCHAERPSSAA